MSQDFVDPPRSIPISLVSGRGHYDEVIQSVLGAKISLWISTANLKALYVETLRGLGRRRGAANYHSIVSDLGDHYKYWYPADPRATRKPMRYLSDTFLVGALRSSTEAEWCAAMRTVLDNADIVIPAHDFRIPKMVPEEWFDVPESNEGDIAFDPIPNCD